jgi:LPS-assembly lipoprotein
MSQTRRTPLHVALRTTTAALLLLTMLAGCGFHLREHAALPAELQPLYIGGDASGSNVARDIRLQLDSASLDVTPAPGNAKYLLLLSNARDEQRIVSVDRRGRIAEYGLTTGISFELADNEGKTVFGPQRVEERRSVINNPDSVISTDEEVRLTREEMSRAVAAGVLRRLGAFRPAPAADTANP